jgi:hypothetical protein
MPTTDPSIWRLFNINLRLLGIGATFAGAVAFVTVGLGLPAPAGVDPVRNVPVLIGGGLLLLLGLGFLMLSPYRPDLGDSGLPFNPWRRPSSPRTWWTGDPRPTR